MKILIPTCNKYIHYIEALQYSVRNTALSKFEFIIIGDQRPKFELDKNWTFVSLGQDEPASKWSTRMRMFLETFPDEHFIYGNDDCAITFIDEERLLKAISVIKTFNYVGRFALMAEGKKRRIVPFYTQQQEIGISQFWYEADYLLSLGWSIYRKDYFLEFCKDGMTPWDFEIQSCSDEYKQRKTPNVVFTFLPDGQAIDGAFFARKNVVGVIPDWHKGYYGHDLEGEMKNEIEKILFKWK